MNIEITDGAVAAGVANGGTMDANSVASDDDDKSSVDSVDANKSGVPERKARGDEEFEQLLDRTKNWMTELDEMDPYLCNETGHYMEVTKAIP